MVICAHCNFKMNKGYTAVFLNTGYKSCRCYDGKKTLLFFLIFLLLSGLTLRNRSFFTSNFFAGHNNMPSSSGNCDLKREPFIFLSGNSEISCIFEINNACATEVWHKVGSRRIKSKSEMVHKTSDFRFIYRAVIGSLNATSNKFSIVAEKGKPRDLVYFRPPDRAKSVKVGVVGDNQDKLEIFGSILNKLNTIHNVDVIVHSGDIVNDGDLYNSWENTFNAINDNLPRRIFMLSLGNHDSSNPPFGTETVYFEPGFASGKLLSTKFLILNSNNVTSHQLDWFQRQAATGDFTFLIVVVHIAPFEEFWYPESWNQGESHWPDDVRLKFVPLFEQLKVDLVISGHAHVYQRGQRNGVRYVITGGGGGVMDRKRVANWSMYHITYLKHHFCVMKVEQSRITFVTYAFYDGAIVDRFEIIKK